MSDAKHSSGPKTLVEEGTHFKGSLTSKCPIEVKGRVEGDLTAPALTVSATGAVQGKAKVGELHSEGEIAGEFDADVVHLSGVVKDNTILRAKSLEVKLTVPEGRVQVMFGECALEIGDMPVREDALAKPEPKAEAKEAKAEKNEKSDKNEKNDKKKNKGQQEERLASDPTAIPGEMLPEKNDRPSVAPPKPERASVAPPPGGE